MGARKAERDEKAERAYRTILGRYEIEDCAESAITDLVTDLRHLSDDYAVDWDALVARVEMHYLAERVL